MDAAIRKALEKIPADRFATAGEMAAALADPLNAVFGITLRGDVFKLDIERDPGS